MPCRGSDQSYLAAMPEADGLPGAHGDFRFTSGTDTSHLFRFTGAMDENRSQLKSPSAPPTVRQIYALAGGLCEKAGEAFPETREQASELIERLRRELGHPAPRLEDTPLRRGGRRRAAMGRRVAEELP